MDTYIPAAVQSGERGLRESLGRVAIVHDYLNQRGGAERCVLEMTSIWPDAPVLTSLYRPRSTFGAFRTRDIRTSPLDRLPVNPRFRALFPLYPRAFRSFGPIDADVVISSSSGWAHAVQTVPRAFHAVYCYTPARWLWGEDYRGAPLGQRLLTPATGLMRRWDAQAARRADLYIAISYEIRHRIREVYGLDAPVVYPPVDVARFTPTPRGDRLLVVSRLLPYKRIDLAVDAATRLGLGLDVVGTGPALDDLRRRAGPTVVFHGNLDDAAVTELFQSCRAFCFPGREDFGIAPVEAQAAGKPVIAFAGGGALETVDDGVSGALFGEQRVEDVIDAIHRAEQIECAPGHLAALANRFSAGAFRRRLTEVLLGGLRARARRAGHAAAMSGARP